MTTLREVRRLFWQYRFGRLSAKQMLDAYRPILDSLAKYRLEANKKLNNWQVGSTPSVLLAEFDCCNEETLRAIDRNDASGARLALGSAITYPQRLKRLCRATDNLDEARQQIQKTPKNSTSWPIANSLLESADSLLRLPIDRQSVQHEAAAKVILLSHVCRELASLAESADMPCVMKQTPDDMKTLNEQLSCQLERLETLFPH